MIRYIDPTKKNIEISENGRYVYLFVGRGKEIFNSEIIFIHKKPEVISNIQINAILFDYSQFNFHGNIRIEKGAVNVNTYLKIDVLLMSRNANANVEPSLEVLEDNVKGGHGATISPVDKEQLSYLKSRGINNEDAEKIIAQGFVEDIVNLFEEELPDDIQKQLKKLDNCHTEALEV